MNYKVDDKELNASTFIFFVNQEWQDNYDMKRMTVRRACNLTH